MKQHRFRVWHIPERKMYFRGYQKLLHVLLCEDDRGSQEGRGRPVRRAAYRDCVFLEGTGVEDKNRREIFEGDIVRVRQQARIVSGVVGPPPDTFGAGNAHPLKELFKKHGISGPWDRLEIEVIGNEFETPELLTS